MVDFHLSFDNHVVDESDECSKTVVVSLGELQNSVLESIFLLLQHHRFVFGSLAHLGVLKVLLFFESSGVTHVRHKQLQFIVDDLLDLLVVMGLDLFSGSLLISNEVSELLKLSTFRHAESLESLHLVESLVDIHEALQESWPSLNKVASQSCSSSIVHLESDVTLPESKDLPNNVVLEELHACKNVEHGRLLHPFTQ